VKNIEVENKNNFLRISVLESNGEIISYVKMLEQLKEVVEDYKKKVENVGIMKSEKRDNWEEV
jgi:VIT1/CCC1 family predicted Fe2+/Mn2+ transporter